MSRSSVVPFVSAGMLAPKKRDHLLARRQLYLNYGALSLATKLNLAGHDTVLVHGEHRSPTEILETLRAADKFPSKYPLMLSIPSYYALPWAREFCKLAKSAYPDSKIVVGGRWVVGPDPEWFQTMVPEADQVVLGLGEPIIESLLTSDASVHQRSIAPTPSYTLDHLLVEGHAAYQPSIEASRGCGMGCQFCEERDIPLERLRPPEAIARSMALVQEQYGGSEIHPYMQASLFAPNRSWADRLAEETAKQGRLGINWRTETRVDTLRPGAVASLASAGLKVVDLGLETASPTQILAMNKSKRPDQYLKSASELLSSCRDNGVMVKVNVLLYAGETEQTLAETRAWLDNHAESIRGVSVGPVIAYGPPRTAGILLDEWAEHGARPVDPRSAFESGITTMHLSRDFDAASAERISLELSRRYMDADAYFDLKGFSYYPRGYTRAQFDQDTHSSDPVTLPFEIAPRTAA
ncbi:radical SAM protein [Bradyrhizobium diazoefficiens]|nr:radical SAM protein [Bradyrhizobium diazoefficiens]